MGRHVPRLYIQSQPLSSGELISLSEVHAHHLAHVLRASIQFQVTVFNEMYGEWQGEIESITKKEVLVRVFEQIRTIEKKSKTTLCFAPIRKERQMDLLEKATELGVSELQPIITDNTSHKLISEDKIYSYLQGAAEQCGRLDIPILRKPIQVKELLSFSTQIHVAIETSLNPMTSSSLKDVTIAIGPEGGWSENELDLFERSSNIIGFSLGSNILRSETAVCSALSIFNWIRQQ
jgi:16S rRNA (uracil1498-N3)-methyltransferase